MPKPKAPRWLTEAFRDGVDERELNYTPRGLSYDCWLAQFDPLQRPCSGPIERAHLIKRERVENALRALLPDALEAVMQIGVQTIGRQFLEDDPALYSQTDLVLLAAWDPRNARLGCAHEHHPRFDSKQMPTLIVPYAALPDHALEFAEERGLEHLLDDRFPK